MRILHVVHGFADESPGGTELHVEALARRQASTEGGGHVVGIFARTRRPGVEDFAFTDDGAQDGVRRLAFNHLGRRGTSFRERDELPPAEAAFARAAEILRPDAVHVHHLAGLSVGVLRAAKARGARLLLTTHDHALACPRGRRMRLDLAPCPVLDRARCARCVRPAWIEAARAPRRLGALLRLCVPGESRRLFARRDALVRSALERVDVFMAPSDAAAARFREFFDPGAALVVVRHGSPAGFATSAPTRPSGRPWVFGVFGAAHPTKGFRTAAQAVASLADVDAVLRIHGAAEPTEGALLRRLARGRAELRGAYPAGGAAERLAETDVVLVPSLWEETFSLVVREAWAARRPVVVSATGALAEAVGPGERRGLAVPPGDVGAWTAALRRVATDEALFARLAGPFADAPETEAFDRATALAGGAR